MLAGIFGNGRALAHSGSESTSGPYDDFWYRPAGDDSVAGIRMSPEFARSVTAVYACVRVIAETMSTLPLLTYAYLKGGGKKRATEYYLYNVLRRAPNRWQTIVEFLEMIFGHAALRGNAYAEIVPGRRGAVGSLIPIHPDRVTVRISNRDGLPIYKVRRFPDGRTITILADNMFHFKGLTDNGFTGIIPFRVAEGAIILAKQTERHGSSLFSNKPVVGGVLEHPDQIGPEAVATLRESLADMYSGAGGNHKPLVLEEGMKWNQLSLTPEDSQFLATRKLQVIEICRAFRVDPTLIQDFEGAKYNTVEQQALNFTMHTVRPWAVRFEEAVGRSLITDGDKYFVEFLLDALLRGDIKSRTQSLSKQFTNGAITLDEWREIENRNPLPDGLGKRHYIPVNLQPIDAPVVVGKPVKRPGGSNDKDATTLARLDNADGNAATTIDLGPAGNHDRGIADLIAATELDAADRIVHQEIDQVRARASKELNPGLWVAWLNRFATSHRRHVARVIAPWSSLGIDVDQVADQVVATLVARLQDGQANPTAALESLEADRLAEVRSMINIQECVK